LISTFYKNAEAEHIWTASAPTNCNVRPAALLTIIQEQQE